MRDTNQNQEKKNQEKKSKVGNSRANIAIVLSIITLLASVLGATLVSKNVSASETREVVTTEVEYRIQEVMTSPPIQEVIQSSAIDEEALTKEITDLVTADVLSKAMRQWQKLSTQDLDSLEQQISDLVANSMHNSVSNLNTEEIINQINKNLNIQGDSSIVDPEWLVPLITETVTTVVEQTLVDVLTEELKVIGDDLTLIQNYVDENLDAIYQMIIDSQTDIINISEDILKIEADLSNCVTQEQLLELTTQLELTIAELTNAQSALQVQVNFLESSMSEKYEELYALIQQNATDIQKLQFLLDETIANTTAQINNLSNEINTTISENNAEINNTINTQITELTEDVNIKTTELTNQVLGNYEDILARLEALEQRNQDITQTLRDDLNSKIDENQQKTEANITYVDNKVTEQIDATDSKLTNYLNVTATNIYGDINVLDDRFTKALNETAHKIYGDMNAMDDRLTDELNDTANNIYDDMNDMDDRLTDELNDTANTIYNNVNELDNRVTDELNETANNVYSNMNDLDNRVTNELNETANNIYNNVNELDNRVTNELNETANNIYSNVNELDNRVTDQLNTTVNQVYSELDNLDKETVDRLNTTTTNVYKSMSNLDSQINISIDALASNIYTDFDKMDSELVVAFNNFNNNSRKNFDALREYTSQVENCLNLNIRQVSAIDNLNNNQTKSWVQAIDNRQSTNLTTVASILNGNILRTSDYITDEVNEAVIALNSNISNQVGAKFAAFAESTAEAVNQLGTSVESVFTGMGDIVVVQEYNTTTGVLNLTTESYADGDWGRITTPSLTAPSITMSPVSLNPMGSIPNVEVRQGTVYVNNQAVTSTTVNGPTYTAINYDDSVNINTTYSGSGVQLTDKNYNASVTNPENRTYYHQDYVSYIRDRFGFTANPQYRQDYIANPSSREDYVSDPKSREDYVSDPNSREDYTSDHKSYTNYTTDPKGHTNYTTDPKGHTDLRDSKYNTVTWDDQGNINGEIETFGTTN